MSMRTPRRFCSGAFGEGSLNGKAVAPKPMRWWFVEVCLSAAWARGERSSCNGVVGCLSRDWMVGDERRLDERKRFRRWRAWTFVC